MRDPNPQVNGNGVEKLRAAGIQVDSPVLEKECRALNPGFIKRMQTGLPLVRCKLAMSLDGRTAMASGESQWITGEAARADGHAWRARASAILTGIGTVREDNPRMTVRAVDTPRQPQRVLIDSQLDVPPHAQILAGAPTLIFCGNLDSRHTDRANALRERGAEIVQLPNAAGKVDLPGVLSVLGERNVNELHVEAGYKLNGSLLREGCVDELLVYLAPSLLGMDSMSMFNLGAPETLEGRVKLNFHAVDRIGDDLRILARFAPQAAPEAGTPPAPPSVSK
jgi:diaminohydroxyphosphoribosylaminopyrimidine deaminase / 5-amino-6-(5-phosphoribosylamino)uracil reductase